MNSGSSPFEATPSPTKVRIHYNDKVVRQFCVATLFWGIIGMAVGVLAATQLAFWQANANTAWLTFGRLRPLHTNAVIFAFVGNMMFAGVYYSLQRLVKARLASDFLSSLNFWGWQLIIVAAAITLPLGLTRGKEYAELIWPINIAVAIVWILFGLNFFWTLRNRRERTLYVAIWFYIATIITVAILYIVNHLQIPTSWTHAYPVFGGIQDALVQWWYGHNAVAFFLTTPMLGIMYYFVPKAAGRPVYSYRLSIIHFWSIVFLYIWAGPHHLLNTALPSWLQSLGMVFSLMLWAPSWGGMLNGLLTLRGVWNRVRTEPVLQFFAAAVTFYGMSTFEGPLLSIKSVNALSHYTDWTVGHVHSGALGWNGFLTAGMLYWLVPRLWNRQLHSTAWAQMHFWLGMVGILLYVAAMWVSGITQGLMLSATKEAGSILAYPNFLDAVTSTRWLMHLRAIGGTLYLAGFIILGVNLWKTIRGASPVESYSDVIPEPEDDRTSLPLRRGLFDPPVLYSLGLILFAVGWGTLDGLAGGICLWGTLAMLMMAVLHKEITGDRWSDWYDRLLANALPFSILTTVAVLIGGIAQILPTVMMSKSQYTAEGSLPDPYSPLQLYGRDLYVMEGCYNCHSQMIRTLVGDVLRYGPYSRINDSVYDHPFQWGSKRTGPDLARVGGKYSHDWHYQHMLDPRQISAGSTMPAYPWLFKQRSEFEVLPARINAQRKLGVPYPAMSSDSVIAAARTEATTIARELASKGAPIEPDKKIVALIAYLQRLGKPSDPSQAAPPPSASSALNPNSKTTHVP
jgi:cytochrome c oxidase cbb3-type subunit I/II